MYLRTTQRRNKDGSVVRYVQLAHNRRKGDSTQAEVLINFGREDQLDLVGLRRLVGSIGRYLDGTRGLEVDPAASGLVVEASRPLGATWLLDGLWQRLRIAQVLREVLDRRRFTVSMERVLFALVAGRAIAPASKLATAEWASADVAIPGLAAMDKDQAMRAMDLLVEADVDGQVQQAVFFAVADLLNLEVDVLFFDTTSTYFEIDEADEADEATHDHDHGGGGFRRFGHSKDHRPDLPQVVVGLAVTREGIPVRVWCWPGNTNDQTVLPQVKDDLRGWRLGRVVWVVDRGFSADANLAYLTRAGGHWIAGERMRDGSPDATAALARQGRYQTVRDNLRVKEVRIGSGDANGETARRFVICHNPQQAERDQQRRAQQVAAVEAELARIAALRAKATATATAARTRTRPGGRAGGRAGDRAAKPGDDHHKAECALRDHPTLGRWVRQTPGGRLAIDRAKIKAETRLDGKFLLSTSDPDLAAEDIALGYKNLLEAERAFRDLKTTLELRPVYHRLEQRIRAHVLLCWLALLLVRLAERTTGTTWRTIARELGRLHLVRLAGPDGHVAHTTRLTAVQRELFHALQIAPPPPILTVDPS
jgi:Transposase DDE domain